MKFFNTAGPVNQPEHYKLDPLTRWNLDEILTLIDQKKYFMLHAPDVKSATAAMINVLSNRHEDLEQRAKLREIAKSVQSYADLNSAISYLSESSSQPLVLLIDEIDSLIGDTLVSVLRQLRAGYDSRPEHFPISVMLCGYSKRCNGTENHILIFDRDHKLIGVRKSTKRQCSTTE